MRIKTLVLGTAIAAGLAWAGYVQYQDPRVKELFGPGPARQVRPAPTASPNRPAPPAPPGRKAPVRRQNPPEPEPAPVTTPSPESAQANRQLGSTILGILAARQLASGISLTVTDQSIAVIGEVDEKAKKEGILDVLEKARGTRRLDSSGLTVSAPENP